MMVDLKAWRDRLLRHYIGDDEERVAAWAEKADKTMRLQAQIDFLQKMLA
jgi:pyruvate-formate lyase-activating enzyme